MLGALVNLLIWIVIAGVIWWAVHQLLPLLPLTEPFTTIIRVVLTIIIVIIVLYAIIGLLGALGGGSGIRFGFPRLGATSIPMLA